MPLKEGSDIRYFGTGHVFMGDVELGDECEVYHGVMVGYAWPGWNMPGGPTRIGARSKLYPRTIVGTGTELGEDVICDPDTSIGCNTKVGNKVQFTYRSQVFHRVKIGNDCWIGGFVPDDTTIKDKATFLGTITHRYPYFGRGPVYTGGEKAPTIEEYSFVGMGAIIVGEVTIGKGAYIGAGTVVTKDVEPGAIMVGNPARRIGSVWEKPGCDPELLKLLGRSK